MSQTPIKFAGSNFTLLVIYIYDVQIEKISQAIKEKIKKFPDFFKNAPVVINLNGIERSVPWRSLLKIMLDNNLRVIGVSGCSNNKLKQTIMHSGLPILTEGKKIKHKNIKINSPELLSTAKTQFINIPVRSGQQIYIRNSDLIVNSSVSSGAEIIADGNIHVYGMMHGRIIAGASGDKTCQIFCTNLFPELVSIAGRYWISDQIPAQFLGKAARLCLLESGLLGINPLI